MYELTLNLLKVVYYLIYIRCDKPKISQDVFFLQIAQKWKNKNSLKIVIAVLQALEYIFCISYSFLTNNWNKLQYYNQNR